MASGPLAAGIEVLETPFMREDQQQPAKPGMSGRGTPEGPNSLHSEGPGSPEDAKSETLSEAAEDIARQWDTAVQPRQRAAEAQSGKCWPKWVCML